MRRIAENRGELRGSAQQRKIVSTAASNTPMKASATQKHTQKQRSSAPFGLSIGPSEPALIISAAPAVLTHAPRAAMVGTHRSLGHRASKSSKDPNDECADRCK